MAKGSDFTEMRMKSINEKRYFPRYEYRADKVAYVAIRPLFKKLGRLKDMSMGGLGFNYSSLWTKRKNP